MKNEFTAIIERDGEWFIGYCPEIPGANGQGRTVEECRNNLGEAIALILEDRRQEGYGDYTQERERLFAGLTLENLLADIEQQRKQQSDPS